MLLSMRRHSLRLQHQLHRWSISDTGSHLSDSLAPPACMSRSKSCTNSTGESDGSRYSLASSDSTDSVISTESTGNTGGSSRPFHVVLLGARGVGKSAIASIFAGAMDSDEFELCGDEVCEQTITVDGEKATVTLVDNWDSEDEGGSSQDQCIQTGDAYLLVYSITDRSSFLQASELRISLRQHRPAHHTPIILVGNKCDLVRRREVSITEGRACAAVFDCKFIETSAAMQHNVWPAFHGIVQQLRLRRDTKENNDRRRHTHSHTRCDSIPKKAKRLLDKMVAKNNANAAFRLKSKSCHDLSVL
ncbi:GTP-binding protein GEM-like [Coregonus clupeaformis]|uniref:GTP-binding protein GEM-like n=1 Tax=Coregonus clupeaformis TaxID=59861 RepID=UPI001BDFEB6A|nr:GTP-binding protein GEM-like [Coregonus clupeaformis]